MLHSRSKFWFLLPLLLCVFAIAERVRFFHVSKTFLPVTGDEALAKLKAAAIAGGERPLLFWGTPYQFPLESYLLSYVIEWLPSTAFGARVTLALIALLSLGGFLLLTKLMFPVNRRWPVLLLLLFPSTYVFTLQSAYFIPQHTMTMAFFMLLPLGVLMASRNSRWELLWVALTGFCAGLALSTHFLSLPVVAASTLVIAVGKDLRNSAYRVSVFIPTLIVGLLPYLLTYEMAAETASAVMGRHSLPTAIERFFSPVLWNAFSPLLGLDVVLFPEPMRRYWKGYVPDLWQPMLLGFWLLLGFATFIASRQIFTTLRKERRLYLSVQHLFVAVVWASLIAFCLSIRAGAEQHRYLLPAAWGFPFLFGVVYSAIRSKGRLVLGSVVVLLAILNVVHMRKVMEIWQIPGHTAQVADLHGLKKVVRYLDRRDIDTCYATFWIAYRLTYTTENRIVCDQPFNGRFANWPLPFKEDFDLEKPAALVLSNTPSSRFRADMFFEMLKWHRVEATMVDLDPYFVFHDFKYRDVTESRLVDPEALSLTYSGERSKNIEALLDGDQLSTWQSAEAPDAGSALELRLDEPRLLHRLRIFFERGAIAAAPKYRVEVQGHDGEWSIVRAGITPTADRLQIERHHTRFNSDYRQDISFSPVEATALRIVVEQPLSAEPWRLAELTLSEDAASS